MAATVVDNPRVRGDQRKRGATLDRILLAVDESPASAGAVRAVAALVTDSDARVFVMHVPAPDSPLAAPEPVRPSVQRPASRADPCVDRAVHRLRSLGARATGAIANPVDNVGAELVASARSLACGLIAIAGGGRGRRGAILLGSVAREVVHRADGSVLAVPLDCRVPSRYRRILVAVDGSRYSKRAVAVAAEAAELTGAEVVVLHVCDPHGPPWMRYDRTGSTTRGDPADTAAALVDGTVAALAQRGLTALPVIRPAHGRAAIGYLAADVRAVSTDLGCDILVVGRWGRAGPHVVLGSIAFQLLHSATVPVLIAGEV
jgi:nucleotide-binding universal stress UspA family protein